MPKTCASCGTVYPDEMVFCPTDGISLRSDESGTDLIGTVIADRYLVSKLLGEGGMGRVYLARHVRLPQQAAIKVLHQDMVKDAGAVARFNREAANAARIEHDRVARVFDFGETGDGQVYIAMEFVPGVTLRELLNDTRRVPAARAANLVYQVAEGLDAAHRLNIVHRDLKPDNILVVTDEQGVDRCKVVDFGIAKVTNSSETQLTQAGMLVGTPEFMSPEQVLGEQLDGRSDVYALALVTYEMFSGELPFEGNTPERKLTARLIQDPRPLSATAPDIDWPDALQEAFDHALVREPEGRTASALEFAEAIVAAVEGWTGMVVMRGRTPLSTTAITGGTQSPSDRSTSRTPTPPVGSPATGVASSTPGTQPTATTGARAAAGQASPPAHGASTGASTGATTGASVKAKNNAWMLYAAVAVLAVGGGGYVAFGGSSKERAPTGGASTEGITPANGDDASSVAGTGVEGTTAGEKGAVRKAPDASNIAAPNGSPNAAPSTSLPHVANTPVRAGADGNARPDASTAGTAALPASGITDAQAADARLALDVIRTALNRAPDDQLAAVGARNIPQLTQLLPRLGTATDSTWAYLALVTAYGYTERLDLACGPLRNANRLAFTAEQRKVVLQYRDALTCAP